MKYVADVVANTGEHVPVIAVIPWSIGTRAFFFLFARFVFRGMCVVCRGETCTPFLSGDSLLPRWLRLRIMSGQPTPMLTEQPVAPRGLPDIMLWPWPSVARKTRLQNYPDGKPTQVRDVMQVPGLRGIAVR